MFIKYRDIDNDSNVDMFEIGSDFIIVVFRKCSKKYKYTYSSAGKHNVEMMKKLALSGDGLNAYIMKCCHDFYVK
ncbi:MAG: hypothetical protein MJ228_03380 [Bacilli bacterium]|nr:hypothetical protein [Bacilli bacterium]